jgi:hypothetical protein
MKPIVLKPNQEIRDIRLEIADNGGVILRYCIFTPALSNTESSWNDHIETYEGEDFQTKALTRINELYQADLATKLTKKGIGEKMGYKSMED